MGGMDSIFDALSEKVDIGDRLATIDHLFSHVKSVSTDDWFSSFSEYDKTVEEAANGPIFLSWPYRAGTANPLHMKKLLGITKPNEISNDRVKVCHFLEYVYNITDLVYSAIKNHRGECNEQVLLAIAGDAIDAAGVLGMRFIDAGDGRYLLCVNDAPIVEAAAIAESDEMASLVEYLHFANGGKLDKKSDCLARLYKGYEGRQSKLAGDEFSHLRDEIGLVANSLDTRHNNRAGRYAKPALDGMSKTELEGWYDYLAGLFAEAILAERRIDMKSKSKALRSKLSQ